LAQVELATILISDLVGSTGLASSVGPERADELRHEHFTALRQAIVATGGSEVKNTGDGLMVAFQSASAAVECAISMQQLLDRRNRGADQQLHVRVGIGTGEATVENGDYFGMPPTEAARLCDKAGADGILISALTRMMATRREGVGFESAGQVELKGIPEPVEAFAVSWERLTREKPRSPLPAVLRSVPPVSYVGRVEERALLSGALQEASAGQRRVALLSGEPGIGKTRLASHTALEAHAAGFTVLWGAAHDELSAPYLPWADALGHYVEHAPDETLRAHVERHGGELVRLVPGLARRIAQTPQPRESDPETERYLLFGAVVGLLEGAGADARLAIVLDDLHWADGQALSLLKHVVEQTRDVPLLIVGSYRESDLDRAHPLTSVLADLRRCEGIERIQLDGLGTDEVVQLMSAAAGHEMDELGTKLAGEIVEETGGNPFFVGEILHNLTESGALVRGDDGRWRLKRSIADLGLPASVRDVVTRRVARLGDELERILTAAAVIGRSFDVDLLARLVKVDEDDLLDALDQAVESAVLTETPTRVGSFTFANALINHTLYERLGATRRARMHQRAAEALEELCGADPGDRLPELAHHWSRATVSVDPAKAIGYARQAGERALAELAPDDGLRWFNQALELLGPGGGDSPDRADALIGVGAAQRQLGDPAFRDTVLRATGIARRLDDGGRLVRAALANTRGWHTAAGLVDGERVEALEAAIAAAAPNGPDRARLLAHLAGELTFSGDFPRVRALIDEALTTARAAGDRRALADVLSSVSNALLGSADTAPQRWDLSRELTALADDLADPQRQFFAALWSFPAAVQLHDLTEMERSFDRLRHIGEEVGQPIMRWASLYYGSLRAHLAGDLDAAEARALEAAGLGHETGQADALMIVGVQLLTVRHEQGRLDELVDIVAQRAAENPGIPTLQGTLAFAYSELGRLDEAAAIFDDAASRDFTDLPFDVAWAPGISRYSEVAARLGASGPAASLYDKLLPYRDQIVTSVLTVNGSVERILGVLAATTGRLDAAERHLAAAADVHETLGAPLFLARTWLNWGRAVQPADPERARDLLNRAAALADAHGGAAITREAEGLLAGAVAR
jgi:class 3 adenylate cyclase/tetratricopeptide (TPR) repeat protein